jgi:exopolysaccharide biosynthesis predicted pyruvyltransferase EpsI
VEGEGMKIPADEELRPASDSRAVASALRGKLLATYSEVIRSSTECALIDFPDYSNVGDSAIWLGEVALLRELGVRIRYCCTFKEWSLAHLRKALPPGGLVLINGGGNFGTLWPPHQQLRERVLTELRDYRVVQLPQSIHYGDDASVVKTATLIADHPDFTLLVRDLASFQIATERLRAKTVLCPDSALALAGTLQRPQPPQVDCFVLARTDKEKTAVDLAGDVRRLAHGLSIAVDDWLAEPRSTGVSASRWLRFQTHEGRVSLPAAVIGAIYAAPAQARLDRGLRMLAQGRVVITDRLHGLILSAMAGIACVALDNHYGKVCGFHRQWLEGWPQCMTAATVPEALDKARSLMRQGRHDG